MMKQEFCPLCNRFIGQPALEQVLLEHIALLGQQFLRTVGEDDTNALDVEGFDMVREFKVQVLNSELRKALSTVNRRTDFRVRFEDEGGKAGSRSMEGGRTASRSRSDDHDVVHASPPLPKRRDGSP